MYHVECGLKRRRLKWLSYAFYFIIKAWTLVDCGGWRELLVTPVAALWLFPLIHPTFKQQQNLIIISCLVCCLNCHNFGEQNILYLLRYLQWQSHISNVTWNMVNYVILIRPQWWLPYINKKLFWLYLWFWSHNHLSSGFQSRINVIAIEYGCKVKSYSYWPEGKILHNTLS